MNAQRLSRGGRTPDPRVRHEPVWRDVPRRAENSTRDLLSLAASLWVAVTVLAGLAVAVVVLWPLLALVAAAYVARRPIRSAAFALRRQPARAGAWLRGRRHALPAATRRASVLSPHHQRL